MRAKESTGTSLTLTLLLLNLNISQDVGKWFKTKAIKCKSTRVHQIVKILNRPRVLDDLLHVLLVPAFKLGSSLDYTRQWRKELVTTK